MSYMVYNTSRTDKEKKLTLFLYDIGGYEKNKLNIRKKN